MAVKFGYLKTPLLINALYLFVSAVASSGLGFIFWQFVSQRSSPEAIGTASGYINLVALLAGVANLGLGFGITYVLPTVAKGSDRINLINGAYTLSGAIALATASLYLLMVDLLTPRLGFIDDSPLSSGAFILFTLVWTWYGALTDQIFIAYRVSKYYLWKDVLVNTLKIVLLMLAFSGSTTAIVMSIAISAFCGLVWALVYALPRLEGSYRPRATVPSRAFVGMLRYALPNHVANWLWQAPSLLLPVIVLNRLGAEDNALFFVAWMIASFINVVGTSVARSLFAEGTNNAGNFRRTFVKTIGVSFVLQLCVIAVIWVLAGFVLGLFGSFYVEEGKTVLRILCFSSLGYTFVSLLQTYFRVRNQLRYLTALSVVPISVIIADTYILGGEASVTSFAWLWVLSLGLTCLLGVVLMRLSTRRG